MCTSQIQSKTNPSVSVIPATKRSVQNGGRLKQQTNIRVAAYCRVSTGDESQQTSYTNQKAYYAGLIRSKADWHFAGIYADEAITGTSRAHRREFNRMMEDAKAGKLDYIVTKSISRFARNTVDTLNCVRELRQQTPPVGIYFEKENIDTLDATGELILTILSALAQEESRSISDNIRWAFQKDFQAGIPHVNLKRMLGYDKGEDGVWVINEAQAVIVRRIFDRFVCGCSANGIAKELNALGYKTVNGNRWTSDGVLTVLRNEKYVGDLEMQKTITKDFLTHRSTPNRGEAPRYYVENHHIGIIDRITWNKTRAILCKKPQKNMEYWGGNCRRNSSPFFNLRCGVMGADGKECGEGFQRLTYTASAVGYTDGRSLAATGGDTSLYLEKYSFAFPVWRCGRKFEKQEQHRCASELLHECAIQQSFMELLYRLKRDHEANGNASHICMLFRKAHDRVCRSTRNNRISIQRLETLDEQIIELEEIMAKQKIAVGKATAYGEPPDSLRQQLHDLERERAALLAEQNILSIMETNFDFFLECLKRLPEHNGAGMALHVNGLGVQKKVCASIWADCCQEKISVLSEQIAKAPDFLAFEKGIYCAFIVSGTVKGDVIEYKTNFGVKLAAVGNSRTLGSFIGFRKARDDGTVELLDAPYKVCENSIQYRRYPRKRAKGMEAGKAR